MPAPEGYVDVAQRIREFYERYPDGSLQTGDPELFHVGDKTYVAVQALAFRAPDDRCPGSGSAWEPVPGPTPFTRDSELQNAETSAWGRAIVALGFETKHIASANEVRNRQASSEREQSGESARVSEPSRSEGASGWPRVSELLEKLEAALPTQDGQNSHAVEIRMWSENKFGKKSHQLTPDEVAEVVKECEHRLKEANVPF